MASIYGTLRYTNSQVPPIVSELQAIFKELPDEDLLAKLRGPRRRGPRGYGPVILWRSYVAYYYMGLTSVSDLIRSLYDNPSLAGVCGMMTPTAIPSQPTFSRFFTKLSHRPYRPFITAIMSSLTKRLYETLPDFGKSIAIDATDMKGWSNGIHRTPTDKDAGWVIKTDTNGRGKFTWGFKLTLAVDTTYELPLGMGVTSGNVHDVKAAPRALSNARTLNPKFHPQYVICDTGYSSEPFRTLIRRQYRATPIIKTHPMHKRASAKYPETSEWQLIYNRRGAVERVFGRMKQHRRLNLIRVRGIYKVLTHCMFSVLILQAHALVTESRMSVRKVSCNLF